MMTKTTTGRIVLATTLAGISVIADAQSPAEAGLVAEELVIAGFTTTTTNLVLDRIDDQDVRDAWADVLSARAAFAAAQSACLDARISLLKSPNDTACQEAAGSAQASLQTLQAAYASETADFEELLFDQVDGSLLNQLRTVRAQRTAHLSPEMLALDWETDEMVALSAAIIQERRCLRRQEEVGDAAATLLDNARTDPNVVNAETALSTWLDGVHATLDGA